MRERERERERERKREREREHTSLVMFTTSVSTEELRESTTVWPEHKSSVNVERSNIRIEITGLNVSLKRFYTNCVLISSSACE